MKCMEVDHFDYRHKEDVLQDYNNLFLASRHCNLAKLQKPTPKERAAGLRLLNPCQEMDYGCHIFEDPLTYELVGVTPYGKYHIRTCDLNAEHLVCERRERAEIWRLIRQNGGITARRDSDLELAREAIGALRTQAEKMIPELPLYANSPD